MLNFIKSLKNSLFPQFAQSTSIVVDSIYANFTTRLTTILHPIALCTNVAELMDNYYIGPADNGRWILRRMDDMETLILLSRQVDVTSRCNVHMCSLISAAYTHTRMHCSCVPRCYVGKSFLVRLSSVLWSGIRSRYFGISSWLVVDLQKYYLHCALILYFCVARFFYDNTSETLKNGNHKWHFYFKPMSNIEGQSDRRKGSRVFFWSSREELEREKS